MARESGRYAIRTPKRFALSFQSLEARDEKRWPRHRTPNVVS
jgi:hypothetical protein